MVAKIIVGVAVVLIAIPLAGFGLFELWGSGTFLSLTGVKFTAGAAALIVVISVVAFKEYERIHTMSVGNPHSLFGQSIRGYTVSPPPPPQDLPWKAKIGPVEQNRPEGESKIP